MRFQTRCHCRHLVLGLSNGACSLLRSPAAIAPWAPRSPVAGDDRNRDFVRPAKQDPALVLATSSTMTNEMFPGAEQPRLNTMPMLRFELPTPGSTIQTHRDSKHVHRRGKLPLQCLKGPLLQGDQAARRGNRDLALEDIAFVAMGLSMSRVRSSRRQKTLPSRHLHKDPRFTAIGADFGT